MQISFVIFCILFALCTTYVHSSSYTVPSARARTLLNKHDHIIILYFENQSFDFLFPDFTGAHGLDDATLAKIAPQTDKQGNVYEYLPRDPAKYLHA